MRLLGAHPVEISPTSPRSLDPGKHGVGNCAVQNDGEHNSESHREKVERSALVHRVGGRADVVPRHEATYQNGLRHPQPQDPSLHRPLHHRLMEMMPVPGPTRPSAYRLDAGKTYCQAHSFAAPGDLR
jgi:hypothetical protein